MVHLVQGQGHILLSEYVTKQLCLKRTYKNWCTRDNKVPYERSAGSIEPAKYYVMSDMKIV